MTGTDHELTPLDLQTLDFEEAWAGTTSAGRKEAAVRELFDESSVRYYSRLNRLLDNTYAWQYKPMLVKRLRRLRDARRAERSAQR